MVNKYRKIILIFIILAGFGLRFYATQSIHITWDEENAFKSAQSINFDYKNLNLPLVGNSSIEEAGPMLYKYIIKASWDIFGDSLFVIRLPFIILSILTILLVYFLTKQALGINVALLSSFLLSISQFEIAIDRTANNAPLHIFLVLLSLFLFHRAVQNCDKKLMLLNGLVLGVGVWGKESVVFLVPIYFIFLLFLPEYRYWLRSKYLWCSFGLSFLIALPLGIVAIGGNAPRYQYFSTIKSIGLSLNGIGLYLGELILLVAKWFTLTGISDYMMEGLNYKAIGWVQGNATFFDHVADTLTRESPPVNFLLGIVILVAVVRAIRKKSSLIKLLVICFLFNFLLFCFIRKSDVIDGIWSLGSLEWGMMGFIPGVILASDMLVGYAKKRKIRGGIFLLLLVVFVLVKTWNMVSYPLCCYFPAREFCVREQIYGEAERFYWSGRVGLAKQTLRKVYQVTDNNRYKTDAALGLAKILVNEGNVEEAKKYLDKILSDDPGNRRVLELLERVR